MCDAMRRRRGQGLWFGFFGPLLLLGLVLFIGMAATLNPVVSAQEASQDVLETLFEQVVGHRSGSHYTWLDEGGRIVTLTAIQPTVGDTYIDGDNRLYEVIAVDEDRTANVVFREVIQLPQVVHRMGEGGRLGQLFVGLLQRIRPAQAAGQNNNLVGIYHSHNAESYLESSGAEFIEPHGEVVDVGQVLGDALEVKGVRVVHSDNSHLPHDGGAYQRSRTTVRELLSQGAVALIDVHRDAIPAEEYRTEVEGEPMTKIRLVVGRQNPNREANLELAQRIKGLADEQYPGLIKGIFNAAGNYNQDVGPRTILLEFGTHETSGEDAAKSAQLLADVFPAAAGLTAESAKGASRQLGGAGWRSALMFALVIGAGGFVYLWINEGSPHAAWQRIRQFVAREAGKVRTGAGDGDGDPS